MKALAKLARAIGFKADPATDEEIEAALAASDEDDPNEDKWAKTHDCYVEEQHDYKARAESAEARVAELERYLKAGHDCAECEHYEIGEGE